MPLSNSKPISRTTTLSYWFANSKALPCAGRQCSVPPRASEATLTSTPASVNARYSWF